VRRGLFEKHKIIFATLLTLKILERSKELKIEEINHLVQGKLINNYPNMPENVKGFLTE